jgi:16S rRNA processing protein RimM
LISVGKILRSQGNRGELKLKFYDNSLIELSGLRTLFVEQGGEFQEYQVESMMPRGKACHIKLRGVDSLSQADSLRGVEVFLPEESLIHFEGSRYYLFQLMGCSVLDLKGEVVGKVMDVLSVPANDLLVVDREGREILIPFHESICKQVDLAKKEIRIDPPAGLLDINEI